MTSRISIDGIARETQAQVRAHFSAFATLTAAFVFLPSILFGLLLPAKAQAFQMPVPGQMPHFPPWFWPTALIGILLQSLVTLTIAAIAGDPARPAHETVGATLARMLPALVRYLGGLVLLVIGYFLIGVPVMLVIALMVGAVSVAGGGAAAANPQQLAGALALVLLPVLLWLGARLSPMAGVFAVERAAPYTGLRRAWALSDGAGWRIALLIIVFSLAAILVALVVQGLGAALGSGAALAGAGGLAKIIVVTVSAAVNALLFILFSAGLGVLYRQLREG